MSACPHVRPFGPGGRRYGCRPCRRRADLRASFRGRLETNDGQESLTIRRLSTASRPSRGRRRPAPTWPSRAGRRCAGGSTRAPGRLVMPAARQQYRLDASMLRPCPASRSEMRQEDRRRPAVVRGRTCARRAALTCPTAAASPPGLANSGALAGVSTRRDRGAMHFFCFCPFLDHFSHALPSFLRHIIDSPLQKRADSRIGTLVLGFDVAMKGLVLPPPRPRASSHAGRFR